MLSSEQVVRELAAYRLKLLALGDRFAAGERSALAPEAQSCGDDLVCLMEEAPLEYRKAIDYLVDRYEFPAGELLELGMRPHLMLLPVVLFSTPAFAASCTTDFLGGKAPAVTSSKLTVDFQLCFDEYTVGYSATSRTPLWSAEDLTATQLAVHVPRKDDFHAETQLPVEARAEIADYSRTGFDKGHMTPADDELTAEAERQSFSRQHGTA